MLLSRPLWVPRLFRFELSIEPKLLAFGIVLNSDGHTFAHKKKIGLLRSSNRVKLRCGYGQDGEVKTVTETELFTSEEEAIPAVTTEFEHTQKKGESPEGLLASAAKFHDLQYVTNSSRGKDGAAVSVVEACADLPWKSPATVEADNLGEAQLDDKQFLIPDIPLKPAEPPPDRSASAGDRELLFLLDALTPDGRPTSADHARPPTKESSQNGSATKNVISFEKVSPLNSVDPQAKGYVYSEMACNQHAQANQQGVTPDARIMQPCSKVACSHASTTPSRRRSDEGRCISTTQRQQPRNSAELPSAQACGSSAPSGNIGQRKAESFWVKLCCKGDPETKYCRRRGKAATPGAESTVCSRANVGAGAPRTRRGKLLRISSCRRFKA